MDDLSLRVYLENGSDAMRGGWLELPVVPERLDAFMRGVVGVDDGDEYARSRQEAAAMSAEASQARGAAGGADEFDTFGEPADVQDGYLPGDPADPTTMLDPSSGMGATL